MSIKRQDLDSLSAYELNDLIVDRLTLAVEVSSVCITLIFAYFTVAYVVGKTVNKVQLYSFTTVYSLFILSSCGLSMKMWMAANELFMYRDGVGHLVHMMTAPASLFLGWALSIVFMIDCRNKNKNKL
jgi:hypothetical protein